MFAGRDFGGNQASGICDDIRQPGFLPESNNQDLSWNAVEMLAGIQQPGF